MLTALLAARRVPSRPRTVLAVFCGLLAGMITIQKNLREPTPRDFEQAWYAARAILAGTNPYQQVGPGLAVDWPFPLLYPLPAGVVAIPFAPFSVHASAVLFSFQLEAVACACVMALVDTIKPEYGMALRRIDLDGLSVRAFASEAGITPGNAGVRLHRARGALRRQLARSCGTCLEHGCLDCGCGRPERARA